MEVFARIIIWAWVVFLIGWIISGFSTKRAVQQQSVSSRLVQSLLLLAGSLMLINYHGMFEQGWLASWLVPRSGISAATGVVMTLFGLLFSVWARFILGRNWSGVVTIKHDHELIVRGPYRVVRHPIYTGLLIAFLGTALAIGMVYAFIAVALFALCFWLKLQTEEQFMLKEFGAQYADYRRHTRALIPFIL